MTPPKFTHSLELPLRLGRRAVQGRLDYTSDDPHAVTLTVTDVSITGRRNKVAGSLARELLRDGCTTASGVGDVQVRPGRHESKVMIRLRRPATRTTEGGDITFEASRMLVGVFVGRTYGAVPEGREREWAQPLDDELAELLTESTPEGEGSA